MDNLPPGRPIHPRRSSKAYSGGGEKTPPAFVPTAIGHWFAKPTIILSSCPEVEQASIGRKDLRQRLETPFHSVTYDLTQSRPVFVLQIVGLDRSQALSGVDSLDLPACDRWDGSLLPRGTQSEK